MFEKRNPRKLTETQKKDPTRHIKAVELIYDKRLDTFMVKIKFKENWIYYPVVVKETNGNNL